MNATDKQILTETKLKRIAWLSERDKDKEFNQLIHLFNEESLKECFYMLKKDKAVGIDGVTKEEYERQLDENIKDLITRMKRMQYRPGNVREVLIPKEGKANATRPLGISNLEDKIIQKMMQRILEAIYEPLFRKSSYGFRTGRGCHDAVRALYQHVYSKPVGIVLDVDIKNYFGSIRHSELENILRTKIKDQTFMRYMIRMFKAGILRQGELTISEEGVMQGSICTPILANIFAHHVIDEWFEDEVVKRCKGKVAMTRYADDICIASEYNYDAERIRKGLAQRLNKFKLELNTEKTTMVNFKPKEGGRFDFLGFTFYWGKSRKGNITPKVKTAKSRLRSKLKKMKQWIKGVRNKCKLKEIWDILKCKIAGHIQYYGVTFNYMEVKRYIASTIRIIFKWLNRRSQRISLSQTKLNQFMEINPLPRAKICHKLH